VAKHPLTTETIVKTTAGLNRAGYHYVEAGQPEPALSALVQGDAVLVRDSAKDGDVFEVRPEGLLELEASASHPADLTPEQQSLRTLLGQISDKGVSLASFGAAGACPLSQAMAQVVLSRGDCICLMADPQWQTQKGNYYNTTPMLTTDDTKAVRKQDVHGRNLVANSKYPATYTKIGMKRATTAPSCPGVLLDAQQLQAMSPALLQYLDLQAAVKQASLATG
jgi:hypothetical protein